MLTLGLREDNLLQRHSGDRYLHSRVTVTNLRRRIKKEGKQRDVPH